MSQDKAIKEAMDKKFEQQKSDSQTAALQNQAEGNFEADSDLAAERMANNLSQNDASQDNEEEKK